MKKFEDWKKEGNFFRFMENDDWACVCCSCGCGWFRDKEGNKGKDTCDKGTYIEQTDLEVCNLCGDCVPVCAFDARKIEDDKMIVISDECYGCQACEYVCPVDAIEMILR